MLKEFYKIFVAACYIAIIFFGINSYAQKTKKGALSGSGFPQVEWTNHDYWDTSVLFGTFLPFGIKGVRDNYPMWGAMVSHGSVLGQVEYQFYSAKAKGVILYSGGIGLRWDFRLYDALDGFFGFGGDVYYYQRKRTTRTVFPFVSNSGMDMKFGITYDIVGGLKLRGDVKSNMGPGRTVFVGIGLMWRFGQEGDSGAGPP